MGTTYNLDADKVTELIGLAFSAAGMVKEEAYYHGKGLVEASLRGIDSHGIMRTPNYLRRIKNGAINPTADVTFDKKSETSYVLDANGVSGYTAGRLAMERAVDTAEKFGLGLVFAINSNHFGAGALYSQIAVDRGMVGITASNVKPNMTAPGVAAAVVGNNPLAVGVPTHSDFSFMVDMAMSVVAGGKLKMAVAKNEKIPLDWATDKEGNPTDDPKVGFDGYFLPVGGFKGIGLAYLIDILCGVVAKGAYLNQIKSMFKDEEEPSRTGHMFLAVNIKNFISDEDLKAGMEDYRKYIQSLPVKSGNKLIFPGEIEDNTERERRKNGIPTPESVYKDLVDIATETGYTESLIKEGI